MNFKTEFLKRWDNAQNYTLAVAEAMPEAQYNFQLAKGMRTFAELLIHIGEAQRYTANQGIKIPKKSYKGDKNDKKALLTFVRTSYADIREVIQNMEDSDFEKTVSFWDGKSSVRRILIFTNDHLTHHRGQATVYLRLQGIKPPDYIGW